MDFEFVVLNAPSLSRVPPGEQNDDELENCKTSADYFHPVDLCTGERHKHLTIVKELNDNPSRRSNFLKNKHTHQEVCG